MTANPKRPLTRSLKHLYDIRDMACFVCWIAHFYGRPSPPNYPSLPSVAAHFRAGLGGGMGVKPSDLRALPLCVRHHDEQHAWPGGEVDWWIERVVRDTYKRLAMGSRWPDVRAAAQQEFPHDRGSRKGYP